MKYDALSKRPVPVGHPNDRDYGMGCIHMINYGPSDQFAIKKVQHASKIKRKFSNPFGVFTW
jgi:hypothetical protein